jgi:hypothetical protein
MILVCAMFVIVEIPNELQHQDSLMSQTGQHAPMWRDKYSFEIDWVQ